MTKEAFYSFFQSVPKAELHLHLEAVISKGTIRRFYMRKHPELNEAQADEKIQKNLFSYYDLDGFIKSFIAIQNLYESPADFDYVFADLRDYLVRNGVVYAEVFVAPSAFVKNGFDFAEMVEVFHRNIVRTKEETGITVRLLIDVSRTYGAENAEQNLNLVLEHRIPEIIGIGLGGSEQKGPANLFGNVFAKARNNGLVGVAHAGEDVGPESVWDTIDILKASRVGHGISAMQSEKLMETLAERKIPLEICLTSNSFTKKFVKDIATHPMRTFYDKGIVVTLNSDDPLFFGSELLNEYWNAYHELKFTFKELKQIVRNSFTASFMTEAEKKHWLDEVEAAWKKKQRFGSASSRKLFVSLFAPLLAVAAASGVMFAVVAGKITNKYVQSETFRTLESLSSDIKAFFAPASMCVENFAKVARRTEYRDELNTTLFTLADTLNFSNGLYYGSRTSRYQAGGLYLDSTGWDPPSSWEPAERPWFQGADAAGGALYFEEPYVDEQTHELCVTVAQAVLGADGRATGVVGVDLLMDEISTMVDSVSVSEHSVIYILSADGTFLTNPDKSKVTTANYFDDSNIHLTASEYLDGTARSFIKGGRYYAVSKIGATPWFIVAEGDVSDFNGGFRRIITLFELLLFFCCVVFALLNIRTVTRLRRGDRKRGEKILEEVQYLAISAKENAATSQEQSTAVKEIVATMEDNTKLSESITHKIKDVAAVAGKTSNDVSQGVALLEANVRQMREIADSNAQTIEGIKALGGKIENIWNIVTLINSVADQAKIIAFNAELEAAAAGDAGKNFHIVASEIRRLADGIIDGTREIKQQITEIQDSSDSLILASEGGTEKIKMGVAGAQTLSARFTNIQTASDITADSAGDITTIIQQQAVASEQILLTLKQIAFGVENFSSATEQISGAAAKLDEIAAELNK